MDALSALFRNRLPRCPHGVRCPMDTPRDLGARAARRHAKARTRLYRAAKAALKARDRRTGFEG